MNCKSFCHFCVPLSSFSACLAHLANPATVRPPRTAAGFLDWPVFFCLVQRFSHGQIPLLHFHGVKLNDKLALCLVSRSQQEMAAPQRPIWREKIFFARTSLPKHFLFHRSSIKNRWPRDVKVPKQAPPSRFACMLSHSVMSNSLQPHGPCQVPLCMGFSRQEHRSGLPSPCLGDLPDPGIESGSPALQADSLPSEPPGKPRVLCIHRQI